ncbi:MAG: hypothetical protein HZR80_21035 [Candidatus Heimdallarchaeota archaeon]
MSEIPFSKNWSKLQEKQFTTIRKRKMAKIRWINKVINRATKEEFDVSCHRIDKLSLQEIPTDLLLKDTDSKTREEAITKIQSFYRKPLTDDTIFYVHYLEKVSYAKPCAVCGGYYPGDCSCGFNCQCDGCKALRAMEDPANHQCCFNSTRGDVELEDDIESPHYGKQMLVMECDCGETQLQPLGIEEDQDK